MSEGFRFKTEPLKAVYLLKVPGGVSFKYNNLQPRMIAHGYFSGRICKKNNITTRDRLEKTREKRKEKTIQITDWHAALFITMTDGGKNLWPKNTVGR